MNKLQIDLSPEETRLVVEALSRLPYHQVCRLIASIEEQAHEQMPVHYTGWSEDDAAADESLNLVP